MIETYYLPSSISSTIPVLTAASPGDPSLWNFFLFIFIIGSIAAIFVLLSYSKKPEDWQHKSAIREYYASGRLKDLGESIKLTPVDYSDDAPLRKLIRTMFYEKIRSVYGLSAEEIQGLNVKNKKKLEEIIQDKEIVDWILNVKKKEDKSWLHGIFNKSGISGKEQYLMDINSILEKMEAWGE